MSQRSDAANRLTYSRWNGVAVCGLLILTLAGCFSADIKVGPKEDAIITGKVTYKGKPVTDARVSFENPTIGAFGTEFKDGAYSIPKGSSGEFTVAVTPVIPPMTMTAPKDGKTIKQEKRTDIPKKYQDASKSNLKTTFKPGENTYDIEMVD